MAPPVRTAGDPTAAVLSKSALSVHGVCDYVVNVATGCRHGCAFCYVPSTPPVRARKDMIRDHAGVESPGDDWGDYVLYREALPERLDAHLGRKRTWRTTERGRGIVGVSFSTDPYMDDRAADIATEVVRVLTDHGKHVRVLTRNPPLALKDLDVFEAAGDLVTVGTSIPALDPDVVRVLEPRAPSPQARLDALQSFADAGVQVYAMASPTFPHMGEADLRALLERIAAVDPAVVFHEPFNARSARLGATVDAASEGVGSGLASEFERLSNTEAWLDYAVRHSRRVEELGADLELPVHLCPHHQLVEAADGEPEDWFRAWRERQPPEQFAGRPEPAASTPQQPTSPALED